MTKNLNTFFKLFKQDEIKIIKYFEDAIIQMKNEQVVAKNLYLQITIFLRSTFHILFSCKIKI